RTRGSRPARDGARRARRSLGARGVGRPRSSSHRGRRLAGGGAGAHDHGARAVVMTSATVTTTATKPRISRVFAALTLGRVMEQGLLGLAMLLLAARLGVRDFAPVSVLFVVNSLSATLADHGVAYSVLRL